MGNVRPSSVSKNQTSDVCETLRKSQVVHGGGLELSAVTVLPRQCELAEAIGKWISLDVSPSRKPNLAALFWFLGFHWNLRRGVWQHPCGKFDPLGSHPIDPRTKYRCYFPADVLPA